MAGLPPILSGRLIDWVNQRDLSGIGFLHLGGFQVVFLLSAAFRGPGFLLASGIREIQHTPFRTFLKVFRSLHSLQVTRLVYRLQDSGSEPCRRAAADRLGELRNPLAIGGLIGALRDPSREVSRVAAEALGKIGVAEATEPLAAALFDAKSGIQGSAARALARIGGAESLKALLANLRNLSSAALLDTIDALGRMGRDTAILPLVCLFHETDSAEVRERIASALMELTETDSMEEVLGLLRERRPVNQQMMK
jgi:HEAT repeat protein